MRGIILAAGRGSRMGKMTEELPKCMIQLFGKRLIDWQLEALRANGINDVGVVNGYKKHVWDISGLTYFTNEFWSSTNMVSSLLCADSHLREDSCIISYSDLIYSPDAVRKLTDNHDDICILYDRSWLKLWKFRFSNPLEDAETFKFDNDNYLLEIGNKTDNLQDIQGQYMGLLKSSPEGWRKIKNVISGLDAERVRKLDMTSLIGLCLKKEVKVRVVPNVDAWFELDNNSDWEKYNSLFLENADTPVFRLFDKL